MIVLSYLIPAILGIWLEGGPAPSNDCYLVATEDFTSVADWNDTDGIDGCDWFADSGQLELAPDGGATCDNATIIGFLWNQDIGSLNQWASIIYEGRQDDTLRKPGIILRAQNATTNGAGVYSLPHTIQTGHAQEQFFQWAGPDSDDIYGECDSGKVAGAGDRIGVLVYGSSADPPFYTAFWVRPTGADPDNWGSPDCCIFDGGGSALGTVCAATTVAPNETTVGNFAGLRASTQNSDATDFMNFDDFEVGYCD